MAIENRNLTDGLKLNGTFKGKAYSATVHVAGDVVTYTLDGDKTKTAYASITYVARFGIPKMIGDETLCPTRNGWSFWSRADEASAPKTPKAPKATVAGVAATSSRTRKNPTPIANAPRVRRAAMAVLNQIAGDELDPANQQVGPASDVAAEPAKPARRDIGRRFPHTDRPLPTEKPATEAPAEKDAVTA